MITKPAHSVHGIRLNRIIIALLNLSKSVLFYIYLENTKCIHLIETYKYKFLQAQCYTFKVALSQQGNIMSNECN